MPATVEALAVVVLAVVPGTLYTLDPPADCRRPALLATRRDRGWLSVIRRMGLGTLAWRHYRSPRLVRLRLVRRWVHDLWRRSSTLPGSERAL